MFAPSKDITEESSSTVAGSSLAVEESSKHQHTINSSLLNDDTSRAKITWALEVLLNRYSYSSYMNKLSLFAANVGCYFCHINLNWASLNVAVICHGLAPYFWESLVEQILKVLFIVTMFDKSYNYAVKKGQMDLQGRFWNNKRTQADTHCYTSYFLRQFTAVDVYQRFNSCCSKHPKENIMKVSRQKTLHVLSRYSVAARYLSKHFSWSVVNIFSTYLIEEVI